MNSNQTSFSAGEHPRSSALPKLPLRRRPSARQWLGHAAVQAFPREHIEYILLGTIGTIIGLLGTFGGNDVLSFYIPSLIGAYCAAAATVRLALNKQDLVGFAVAVPTFIFYQAYQINPLNHGELLYELQRFQINEIEIGNALSNGLAPGLLIFTNLWAFFWHGGRTMKLLGNPVNERQRDGLLFIGFFAMFLVVAVPNVIWGGVIRDAIENVLYGYSSWEVTGEGPRIFATAEGASSSLVNLRQVAPSLLILTYLLYRTRFGRITLILLPLNLIWSAGVLLAGTRTYLIAFALVWFMVLITDRKIRSGALIYGFLSALALLMAAKVLLKSRSDGLRNFSLSEISTTGVLTFQGNEGLIYHMDAVSFATSGFVSPWSTGNPFGDLCLGLAYEPFEALVIWVPRSLMPWKPQDPTWWPYNAFTWNVQMGRNDINIYRTYSAGFLGRDLIRWGPLGVVIPLIWFGGYFRFLGLVGAAKPERMMNRIGVGILSGIALAMMRDMNFMWTLPFLPALSVILYAHWRASVSGSPQLRVG